MMERLRNAETALTQSLWKIFPDRKSRDSPSHLSSALIVAAALMPSDSGSAPTVGKNIIWKMKVGSLKKCIWSGKRIEETVTNCRGFFGIFLQIFPPDILFTRYSWSFNTPSSPTVTSKDRFVSFWYNPDGFWISFRTPPERWQELHRGWIFIGEGGLQQNCLPITIPK